MTSIKNAPSIQTQQQRVTDELGKATRSLHMGINELVDRFDTRVGEQLFRAFGLTLTLEGAHAGERFLREHSDSIGAMSPSQQAAFRSVLSDSKEVAALKDESARLATLPSLQALLNRIGV
jgi:hypothetical protein